MDTSPSSLEVLDREEVDLAIKLAGFLRPSTLYPGSYPRVQAALVELLECSRGVLVRHGEVSIRFLAEGMQILGTLFRPDHPDLAWMAECFREAVLDGVVLERGGSYQGFLSFSGRLVESRNLAREGRWPEGFWGEPLPGVRPIPAADPQLLLAGLAEPVLPTESQERGDTEECAGQDGTPVPGDQGLLDVLCGCDGIQERLQETAALLPGLQDPARLLDELLPFLPGGGTEGPATVLGMLDQLLERVLPVLASLQPISWEQDRELIQAAFGRVASRLFASGPAPPAHEAAPEPVAPAPSATQDSQQEDLGALLALWNTLPRKESFDLLAGARADALRAQLASILGTPDEAQARREGAILGRALSEPDAEELQVWRACLEPALQNHGRPGVDPAGERLLAWLRQEGRSDLLVRTGLLDLGALRAGFPWLFPLYVEAMDTGNPVRVRELQRFCAELGPRRILAEARVLARSEGILPSRCGNRILAMPGRPLVPFVFLLLRYRGEMYRQSAARFLARAGLELPEAAPFWFFAKPEDLPLEFLTRLCEAELAGKAARELSLMAVALLRRFIEDSAEDPDLAHQRAEAVRALGAFPFPETEEFLVGLGKGAGLMGFRRPPAQLRQACREALEALRGHRKP